MSTWLLTTDESTWLPSPTTAAAVSSHEVSMPRMRAGGLTSSPALVAGHRRAETRLQGIEAAGVVVGVDVVDPHDQCVLVGLGVVVLADTGGLEAEPVVERLSHPVGDPYLEGEVAGTSTPGQPGHVEHEPGPDLVSLPRRVDGDRGHMGVRAAEHETRVADHGALGPGDVVGAGRTQGELAHEQAQRPGPGIDLGLDTQHRAEVAAPHREELDLGHDAAPG